VTRRLISLIAATTLLFAMLPVVGASASAASSARIENAAGRVVLPAAAQTFQIRVANGESSGVLGLGAGRQIDWVRVIPPREVGVTTNATPAAVPGWTGRVTKTSNADFITYTADAANQRVAPGAAKVFDVIGDVAPPLDGDRTGTWQVAVSSNGGETTQLSTVTAGGTLSTAIKVLEIVNVRLVGPAKAAANTAGTVGQTVQLDTVVRNHARNPITVTPNLVSADSRDAVTQAPAASVGGLRGERTFRSTAVLGDTAGQQRLTDFTASATAPGTTSIPAGNEPANGRVTLAVQKAPVVNLRAATFAPREQRGDVNFDVTVTADKANIPAFDVATSTVKFERQGTETPLFSGGPLSFGRDAVTLPLTFPNAIFEKDADGGTRFADGAYDAVFRFVGEDGNGFPLTVETTLGQILNLDNLAPIVDILTQTLPTDRDNVRQTRVKNNDQITVTGRIDDPSIAALQFLKLVDGAGRDLFTVPPGAITYGTANGNRTFTATFRPTFEGVATSAYRYEASARDAAGNTGGVENDAVALTDIDNVRPTLPRRDGADQPKGAVISDARFDTKPVIVAQFEDNFALIGGCNPSSYRVDGQLLVRDVRFSNGEPCSSSGSNPGPADNRRVLILNSEIRRDSGTPNPSLTYTEVPQFTISNDVKDAAGQYSASGVQDTVNQLAPLAPVLIDVVRGTDGRGRNGNTETATFDDGVYYTRFSGTDLAVTVSGGVQGDTLRVTGPRGSRNGIVDENGRATIRLDVLADEGAPQAFDLQFVSPVGIPGDVTRMLVRFDRTTPALRDAVRVGQRDVDVFFSEPVLGTGTNRAAHWIGLERVQSDDGPILANRSVSEVAGSRDQRRLIVEYPSVDSFFAGLEYTFDGTGDVYVDRAGNLLTDPVAPATIFVSPR
jgi:hypothetical protein